MWGQATATEVSTNLSGIIPTRVGTSDRNACRVCKRWDHPHACGDKQDNVEETKQRLGSSPRVWGQEIRKDETNHLYRIIPTRVGTSDKNRTARHFCKDHPHACGDKSTLLRPCVLLQGSSPRVWGQV